MQGDISEGAHLLTEVSALIHQTFPDALITRGASIQFAVVTGVPDVRERLIHLHKKALSLRSNNQLDLKAGIFIVSNPQISPLPLRIMPKQPVPISKRTIRRFTGNMTKTFKNIWPSITMW